MNWFKSLGEHVKNPKIETYIHLKIDLDKHILQ
jgi:hypothetical protein